MRIIVFTAQTEGEDGNWLHFGTLKEAKVCAREVADFTGEPVEVTRDLTVDRKPRELAAMLLNGRGWCSESKTVCVVKPSRAALKALSEAEG